MNFLVWWNPATWLSDGLEMVTGAINHAVRALFYMLDKLIYQLVIYLYKTFDLLCNSRLLDSEVMNEISKRIGLLLGIIMLFMVVSSFIKMLVNPDLMTDSKTGAINIVKKSVIVIIMLGSCQFVFDGLYKVQKAIISENIISKLILPYNVTVDDFGSLLSAEVFTSFYGVDSSLDNSTDGIVETCRGSVDNLKKSIYAYGDFEIGTTCLNETVVVSTDNGLITEQEIMIIDYNWLLATIAGLGLIYFIFMYCISVGVRTIQLAVLEIIAPMAIISYLSPKEDTMFSKWSKIYVSTYTNLFIRIAIINFVVFLIATILDNSDSWIFWSTVGNPTDWKTRTFITVIMILALLTFAKRAPDLIKDLFPTGASKLGFGGIGFKDMVGGNVLKKGLTTGAKVATAGAVIGAGGALLSGASRYKINRKNGATRKDAVLGAAGGALAAITRGLRYGAHKGNMFGNIAKGINEQRSIDDKYDELITSGGSQLGRLQAKLKSYFGETPGQTYTRIINTNTDIVKAYDSIDKVAEKFGNVKKARAAWENAKARGAGENELNAYYDAYKTAKDDSITAALNGTDFGDAKDKAVAAQVSVYQKEIKSIVANKHIILKDKDGNQIEADKINSSEILDYAAASANINIANIKSKEDYASAIANDKAAGVNSNGNKK